MPRGDDVKAGGASLTVPVGQGQSPKSEPAQKVDSEEPGSNLAKS